MNAADPVGADTRKSIEISTSLREAWASQDIVPLWESTNGAFSPGPFESARVWRWQDLRPIIIETAKITSPEILERRVLQLVNRQMAPGADATTGMLNGTVQALMPGEVARPHRHTMNALRFVLEGGGAETIVNGKRCKMEQGDLITTPAMTWHEHRHHGKEPTIWLDVLDVYLHRLFGCATFQPGPARDMSPTFDDSYFATANIVPMLDGADGLPYSPVFRYPWADVLRAFEKAPTNALGYKAVRYTNPVTGGPCMALIDCFVIELERGQRTVPFRTSASAICSVVEGKGSSLIGDGTVQWSDRDVVTLPQHAWVSHTATSEKARLFVASNQEVYRRVGLLTEQHQT